MRRWLGANLWWLALLSASCSDTEPTPAADAAPVDSSNSSADADTTDGASSLSWVDLAVSGCAILPGPATEGDDAGAPEMQPCVGQAPLTLRFTAVAPATVESYRWDFGDGETSEDIDPSHVYQRPGLYPVTLIVGSPNGIAQVEKLDFIDVRPATVGGSCDDVEQCAAGLECLCGAGDDCAPAFAPGRCVAACQIGDPCASGVCANLAAGAPGDPEPWQRSLCLPECIEDSECDAGTRCQDVLDVEGQWVRACVIAGLLGNIGDSCADSDGQPDPGACASGMCAELGARGVCSAPCMPGAMDQCPATSACASFNDGGQDRCVARCSAEGACAVDPWLACETPGAAGEFGFTVDEEAAEFGYCAPKVCTEASECGPDGSCESGYCGPAS